MALSVVSGQAPGQGGEPRSLRPRAHARACPLPRPYQGNPTFDPEFIRSKSTAAAGLCSWCINIVRFYEVYCDVAPKRQALEEANAELAEAQEKLSRIKTKIAVRACRKGLGPRAGTPLVVTGGPVPCPAPPGPGKPAQDLAPSLSQELNANLSNLTSAFEKATAEKIKCQQEADATNRVISLANR